MAKITTTKNTKYGKTSSASGTRPCNICHGTGKVPKKKKK